MEGGCGHVQGVKFVLLLSRQGKVRLSKWYTTYNQKDRAKIVRDITPLVLGRALKLCNFLDYQDIKVLHCHFLLILKSIWHAMQT